jgi:gamma-tubulin complex component 3
MGLQTVPSLLQTDLPPLPPPTSPSSSSTPLQTKAAILLNSRPAMEPSERDLLRDIPYLLLGLPSTHFPLQDKSLSLPTTLPAPIISLLYSLAEPGLLYKSLQSFIATGESLGGDDGIGLVGQSLRGAVKAELSGWMNLVAGIESEIRGYLASSNSNEGGVTLKRCAIWVKEGTLGLRLMSVIIEDTAGITILIVALIMVGLKGGALVDKVHSFTAHGDPYVRSFAHKLLTQITRPWYEMLKTWICEGQLRDPFQEFFVRETNPPEAKSRYTNTTTSTTPKTSAWEGRYSLEESLVPGFIGEQVSRKVFLIGKSLNFIRGDCGEEGYVIEHAKESSIEGTQSSPEACFDVVELSYGNTVALEQSIDKAYLTTTSKLVDLMKTKFGLWEHLNAFKKYILLGQGDFIALLMESIGSISLFLFSH